MLPPESSPSNAQVRTTQQAPCGRGTLTRHPLHQIGQVRTIEKFEASAEIVLHKGRKAEGDVRAFDAREIMTNLGPTIQRPAG